MRSLLFTVGLMEELAQTDLPTEAVAGTVMISCGGLAELLDVDNAL